MSETILGPIRPHICANCENSLSGRNTDERACYMVSGIRMVLFGPRFVKWNHTCAKWALDKKRFGNER